MVNLKELQVFLAAAEYENFSEAARNEPELAGMVLLNRSRLSVQPVTADEYEFIVTRAREPDPDRPQHRS